MTTDSPNTSSVVDLENHRSQRPATPEERMALTFEGLDLPFDWTNEEWAIEFLPIVQLSTIMLKCDDKELEDKMRLLVPTGEVQNMLDGICHTKQHFELLAEILDKIFVRQTLVLERLGYGPENPPPDHNVN